jgi:hypothetical protein
MINRGLKSILSKISLISLILIMVTLISLSLRVTTVYADDALSDACRQFPDSEVCAQRATDPNGSKVTVVIMNIINFIVYLTASISVLMLIFGGFKYVLSQGDSNQTKSGKDTIMYALIGLFISVNAMFVVRYVISKI